MRVRLKGRAVGGAHSCSNIFQREDTLGATARLVLDEMGNVFVALEQPKLEKALV